MKVLYSTKCEKKKILRTKRIQKKLNINSNIVMKIKIHIRTILKKVYAIYKSQQETHKSITETTWIKIK